MIDIEKYYKENDVFERAWPDLRDNALHEILYQFSNCSVQTEMKSIVLIAINFDWGWSATCN